MHELSLTCKLSKVPNVLQYVAECLECQESVRQMCVYVGCTLRAAVCAFKAPPPVTLLHCISWLGLRTQ